MPHSLCRPTRHDAGVPPLPAPCHAHSLLPTDNHTRNHHQRRGDLGWLAWVVLPMSGTIRQDMYLYRNDAVGKTLHLLHRTLKSNSSHRSFCRELVFDMGDERWNDSVLQWTDSAVFLDDSVMLQRGKDLIEWLSNTESLRFHNVIGGNKEIMLPLLNLASTNMTRLNQTAVTSPSGLNLKQLSSRAVVDLLLAIGLLPQLKKVQLVGLNELYSPARPQYELPEKIRGNG
ncbi:hypothetical protein N658DRAFT_312335 [Parathielavia hyrcaniae]|uniref:Uncharacterized protein n=1 Tax=Parathielavia hyrcaniae TaxID=113614 RepID=A0AAN6SY41_9PEZI|nr:hypothetical protein N658DRAFT_312335 [Parathielavia hyrcaniae]